MKSFFARLIEKYFDKNNYKDANKNAAEAIENGAFVPEKEIDISEAISNYQTITFKGRTVHIINDKHTKQNILFYFHGGTYTFPPSKYHYQKIEKLAKKLNLKVVFPLYGRVPEHNYEEEFPILCDLYQKFYDPDVKIFMGGDSAGGGLTCGLCYKFKEDGFPLPRAIILLSPWLNIISDNPEFEKYEATDHMVSAKGPRTISNLWGNGHPEIKYTSPLLGPVEDLPRVHLYASKVELLYPDIKLFADKLKGENIIHFYDDMSHDFFFYPLIREARQAFKDIEKDLKKVIDD